MTPKDDPSCMVTHLSNILDLDENLAVLELGHGNVGDDDGSLVGMSARVGFRCRVSREAQDMVLRV